MSRVLLAFVALIVPPVVLTASRSPLALFATAAWVVAVGIFFFLAWGPGVLLAGLSGLMAGIALLRARRGTG